MKVKEIMTPHAKSIWLTESLADAAIKMWENDCGILPIIKDQAVIGLITDRDICMAMAARDEKPSGISVEEAMTGMVYAVTPDEDVEQAMQMMREHRVRRLPVISPEGHLEGVLSMNDVVRNAQESERNGEPGVNYGDVVRTFKAICEHPVPANKRVVAKA